jgi:DNA-binding transcriptional ArsR family regulator
LDAALDLHLFRALAEGTRLKLFACLVKCGRACTVSELAEVCGVDFSVVNKHLKLMAASGLLQAEKQGRTVWYRAQCGDFCDRLRRLVASIAEWCPNLQSNEDVPRVEMCCQRGGET